MATKKVEETSGAVGLLEPVQFGSMIGDAITVAAELGDRASRASWKPVLGPAVVQTETETWYLQQLAPEAPAEVVKVPRVANVVRTCHAEVGSFADWVARRTPAGGAAPEVFVDGAEVSARWNLETHRPHDVAVLPLLECEAWRALSALQRGVGQKDLHKLLTTVLHGYLDPRLAAQVAMLSHFVTQNCDVAISRTGLADIAVGERLTLHFTGGSIDDKEEIGVEWVYEGPVWTCFEEAIRVPLRMVISKEQGKGLMFEFAPLGLEALMLAYRRSLAREIEAGLGEAGIPVYIGRMGQ